jgi:hypothetical protein
MVMVSIIFMGRAAYAFACAGIILFFNRSLGKTILPLDQAAACVEGRLSSRRGRRPGDASSSVKSGLLRETSAPGLR